MPELIFPGLGFGFCKVTLGPASGVLDLSSGQPREPLEVADFSLAETGSPGHFCVRRKERNRVESLPGAGGVELASLGVIMRQFKRIVTRSLVLKSGRDA